MTEHESRIGLDITHKLPTAHMGEISVGNASHIGPYTFSRDINGPIELGRGGSASVMLAERPSDPRERVAVSVHAGSQYTPEAFGRGVNLLVTLAAAGVPHLVPVEDAGVATVDNDPDSPKVAYMVSPVAEGGTLQEVIKNRKLSPLQVISLVDQLAESLTPMHDVDEEGVPQGFVFGDLSDTNVLFTEKLSSEPYAALPELLLTDLESVGRPTDWKGKELFRTASTVLAPEERMGKSAPQSDTYRVALLAFKAMTGEHLWNQETRDEHMQVIRDGEHDAFVEERLDNIDPIYAPFISPLRRALKEDLGERYQHVSHLAADMREGWYENQDAETAASAAVVYQLAA